MGFAILRTQKLKSPVAVRRSMMHAFREQTTPNADPARLRENEHIGAQSVEEGLAAFNARLPDKVRSNAVLAIEYLVTASPEALNGKGRAEQDAYFSDALAWLRAKHGAENVVYAGIHRDETTPHMYAYVVPLDERGKLNCRAFLGGSKALSQMQTDFAHNVGRQHGFERGVERSRATHQTVREWYAHVGQAPEIPRLTAQDLQPRQLAPEGLAERIGLAKRTESPEAVAERVSRELEAKVRPIAATASTAALERRRAQEMAKTAQHATSRIAALEKALKPFQELAKVSREKFVELVQHAAKLTAALRAEKEQARRRSRGPDIGR